MGEPFLYPEHLDIEAGNRKERKTYSKAWAGKTMPGPSMKQATGLPNFWKSTQYALVSVMQ